MGKFGESSLKALEGVHPKLKEVLLEAIKTIDFKVICGFRGQDEQDKFFEMGLSKVKWPGSKHNKYPAEAVDIAPWPLDWKDERRFYFLAGYIKSVADRMGIEIRQGVDWDGDFDFKDQNFHDAPHMELKLGPPSVPVA